MTVCRFANLVFFFFGMTAEFTDQLMIGFIKTLPDGVFMCTWLTTDLTDTVRIKYTCAIHCMSTHGTGSLVNPHAVFGSLGCIGIQMGFLVGWVWGWDSSFITPPHAPQISLWEESSAV